MKGAPGMPLGAMAQVRPNFLRVGQLAGSTISTDRQPRSRATSHVLAMSHFSPAVLKHQKTMDCLMRPLVTTFPPAGTSAAVSADNGDRAAAAPAATTPRRTSRREGVVGLGSVMAGSSGETRLGTPMAP